MPRSPLPIHHEPCGWNRMLPSRAPKPPARGALSARYAVVGAGYTGLAAARHLAELAPEAEIIVLEGTEVGEGSSGRNSGFTNSRDSKIGLSLAQMDRAERVNALTAEGFAALLSAMETHGFACDIERVGRITGAATARGAEKVRGMIEGAKAHGFEHVALDAAGMEAVTGSRYYRCGIRTAEGYLLQPAKLVRGLADSLPPNVRLFENSTVNSLERGRMWTLKTADSSISAETVILATNPAIKHFGYWRDGIVMIYTFAGISEAMSETDAAKLGEPTWGLLPAHRLGSTLRRVEKDRFLVRSLYSYEKPVARAEARRVLTDNFHRRFPALKHVSLEFVWGGTTALTMNGSPRWGRLDENLYGSAGCNGSGVVKGTILGKRLAQMIVTGNPQEDVSGAYGSASRIAPEPFRRLGFHMVSALERRRCGLEM
ncbi:MAG: FAD-binding oxidoreductase [Methylobacterium sp.]|nr:FAD-binding oxidoreductase [Methylobacterium sp.]MCA3604435.1 FAD-binding oxidoreductase [Methylobacterium sp.]MCA3616059.1 FAD-binding oxidoreductase [Methylobacterium sp.]MCA4909642.1 FAD-binding oxidoreductase [Methylobacterium sp.]